MESYIYSFYKFHSIFILSEYKITKLKKKLKYIIPIEWQIILINEGSFTQNLCCLTGKYPSIKIYEKFTNLSNNNYKNIRCIWLENSIYTKLLFARSIWILNDTNNANININNYLPLGKSIIESKVDIKKKIHEIYYGHCEYLEKQLNYNKPLWGRKYTLYYNEKSYIRVQEFFSPFINKLFH